MHRKVASCLPVVAGAAAEKRAAAVPEPLPPLQLHLLRGPGTGGRPGPAAVRPAAAAPVAAAFAAPAAGPVSEQQKQQECAVG